MARKKKILRIECPYCSEPFRSLALTWNHVQVKHAIDHADRMAQFEREHGVSTMNLPKPDMPENGDFSPFLKVAHVSARDKKLGGKIKMLGAAEPREVKSDYGKQIVFPVEYAGKKYDLAINITSGNYTRLYEKFGPNPKKWKGTFKFAIKINMKRAYIALEL